MASEVQKVIEGSFPERDERLENLCSQLAKTTAGLKKAQDKRQTAYDALKEAMREQDLDEYHCYTLRYKATLGEVDAQLKLKQLAATAPTPFQPSEAEESAK